MTTMDYIDLFAGPGGWDIAANHLGLNGIGIEWDHAACETRRAAGLPTIEGDVRDYGPARYPARGFIASPPCQTFSAAGKGAGRKALDQVLTLAEYVAVTGLAPSRSTFDDERTSLVLEPLRWIIRADQLGTPYKWVALEQVPTVYPVWLAYAEHLRAIGYHVATGTVQAEQYGVPQTRKRAILVARLDRPVALPAPTHSRYHARTPDQLDDGVLPWVSMAEALGWDGATMRSNYGTGGDPKARGLRDMEQPAPTVTSKIDRNRWMHTSGASCKTCPPRSQDEPSRTILGKGQAAWTDGARVTVEEAAALQTFPQGYPWYGTKGQQYQQVGNAIPPLLAEHVLRAVVDPNG